MKKEIENRIEKLNEDLESFWDSEPDKKEEVDRRLAFLNSLYNALYNDFY